MSAFRSVFTPLPAGQHVIFKPTSRMHRPLGQSWLSLPYACITSYVHGMAWIVVLCVVCVLCEFMINVIFVAVLVFVICLILASLMIYAI